MRCETRITTTERGSDGTSSFPSSRRHRGRARTPGAVRRRGGGHSKGSHARDAAKRTLFATDTAGNLLHFRATAPEAARAVPITGLPNGVVLKGIDFRPATGDLYALGGDKVVYRVNPRTAIAVAEGPAFESSSAALTGDRIGFDFNPTVDRSA